MIGYVDDEVVIVPVVYPHETVSVKSLSSFSFVGLYSKPSRLSLPVSVGARHIQEYFKKKRGGKQIFTKQQQDKSRHAERMKRS